MFTSSHGGLAFLFNRYLNRKLKTRVHPLFIVFGAMLPDAFHVANAVLGWLSAKMFSEKWHWEFLLDLSKFMHSFPLFAVIFSLCFFLVFLVRRGPHYGRTVAFFLGWGFFHIVIDIFTHKGMAWPYFGRGKMCRFMAR